VGRVDHVLEDVVLRGVDLDLVHDGTHQRNPSVVVTRSDERLGMDSTAT
jgi:hypothetical protein